jgi:hypothetical protein
VLNIAFLLWIFIVRLKIFWFPFRAFCIGGFTFKLKKLAIRPGFFAAGGWGVAGS